MKKFIIALLTGLLLAVFAVGLAGCGEGNNQNQTEDVTVTYVYNDARRVPVTLKAGGLAASRSVDAPIGQKFEYWYETDEAVPFDFTVPVERDLTLYAKYAEDLVTLRFYAAADDQTPYRTVEKGRGELLDYADVLSVNIYRENYDFAGWTNADGTPFVPGFPMENDVNVYASFTPKEFTVVYYGRTGDELKRETVNAFESSSAPAAPEVADCRFVSFDAHENIVESMADENGVVSVYAHYLPLRGTVQTEGARFSFSIRNDETGYDFTVEEVTGTAVELPADAAAYPSDVKLPFVSVGNSAFANNRKITSVTIPEGYRSIGIGAFENCTALQRVNFTGTSQLQTLGNSAFSGCTSLESFTLSSALTRIGVSCFAGCTSLVTVDGTASALTEIAASAFAGCTALQTVGFYGMESLQTLATRAFYNCQSLTSVRLENSSKLVSVGDQAFYFDNACSRISFYCGADAKLETIGERAFYGAGASTLVFPDSVKRIGAAAFAVTQQESGATSVSLPGTIEYIGDAAFVNDRYGRLAEIEVRGATAGSAYYSDGGRALIRRGTNGKGDVFMLYACASEGDAYTTPAGIATIQPYAFSHLVNLKTLTISEGPTEIPVVMAYNERIVTVYTEEFIITGLASCPLERVNFPASVTKIGLTDAEADGYVTRWGDLQTTVITSFGNCDRLKEVTFPADSRLQTIGNKAFYGSGLQKIVIPAACSSISPLAFYMTGLRKYEIAQGSETYSAVSGMLASADGQTIYSFPYGGAYAPGAGESADAAGCFPGGEVTVPSTVRTIATNAFRFSEDIKSITFETDAEGNGVTRLEDGSFNGFRNLTQLTLPASLESIGEDVFTGTYVVDLVIPAKVREIGAGSFYNMPDLKTVTFLGELPAIAEGEANTPFRLCKKIAACYVPAEYYETYLQSLGIRSLKRVLDCEDIDFAYTLDANGGTFAAEAGDATQTTYTMASPLFVGYRIPEKAGASFVGWYTANGTNGDWGTRVYEFSHATAQTTLYARWGAAVEDGRARETAYSLALNTLLEIPQFMFGTDLVMKLTTGADVVPGQVFGLSGLGYKTSNISSFDIILYEEGSLASDHILYPDARQAVWELSAGKTYYIVITNVVPANDSKGVPRYKDGDRLLVGQSFVIQIGTARPSGGAA